MTDQPRIIRAAASQFRLTTDTETNLRRILTDIDSASERGASVVVFPELALSGYPPEDAESLDYVNQTETESALAAIQEKAKQRAMTVAVGAAWRENTKTYIRAFLISADGDVVGTYDKLHLFHNEPKWFSQGESLELFDIDGVKVGLLICFDIRFPEPWRALRLQGAEIVLHLLAGAGSGEWKVPVLEGLLRTRASENQMFVVSANNAGPVQIVKSAIVDPDGLILAQANYGREELLVADLDLSKVSDEFLQKRRTDIAEVIIKRASRE